MHALRVRMRTVGLPGAFHGKRLNRGERVERYFQRETEGEGGATGTVLEREAGYAGGWRTARWKEKNRNSDNGRERGSKRGRESRARVVAVGCNSKRGKTWEGGRFERHGMGGSGGLQETETWPNRN